MNNLMADKRNIFLSKGKSWITDEYFTKLIKLSFTSSGCCNVFLSDTTEDSETLFSQFRSIYPSSYLLKSNTHDCHEFFLLGSSEEGIMESIKKIPLLQWNTEILIIVNNDISNDSRLLNNSVYGIANINIVSMSGMWILSKDYIKPRVFTKVDSITIFFVKMQRYKEIQVNDKVNLHGRELQVCSDYIPPMTYLNHTIQKTINGVQAEVYTMDSDLDWDGIEMRLFLIMAEKLNFTWTLRKPEGNYTYGYRINDTYWMGGVIQMIYDQKVDLAFAGIWLILDQETFVQLSEPWYQLHIHFLVPRPRRITGFLALKRPFSEEVWFLLLSALLLHSFYTYVRAWIDPKFPKRYRNFLIILTDLVGCLLSMSVPKSVGTTTHKLQILFWQTAGWLIIVAYCSSLAARLSSSEYEDRIDTIEQFVQANLQWGQTGQPPPFADFFDLTNPHAAQLPNRYRQVQNSTQLKQFIKQGNYAIPGKIMDTYLFPTDYISNEDLKNYRLMKEPVGHFYAAFAVQPWLLKPINRIILRIKETGIIIWHLRDVIRRRDNYNLREVLVEHDKYDGHVQVLGLMPLSAGFSLLLVGMSIATFVFYLELKRTAKTVSVRDRLRDIDKKHDA
ncbi:uncharacterized protein LOC122570923 isoform X2 [Bombus pyrosoma]|uniref:uncharacterized protein LOC122570923 isoform X2 n=2 Tax=Bombus pyrosoma TaxID=396416 RepID=UPI001CB97CE5|nr:uncharacterized protein LOC122570923 isoform X2 [Bombus pyrosoma]